jgi:hypothetical protein
MRSAMLSFLLVVAGLSVSSAAQNKPAKDLRIHRFFPTIVAQVALTAQTASIPTTTLITPKQSGLYRLSAYAVPTATVGESEVLFFFVYADNAGPETLFFPVLANNQTGCVGQPGASPDCSFISVVRDNAGVPLTFSATVPQGSDLTYDLFITVEQLQ